MENPTTFAFTKYHVLKEYADVLEGIGTFCSEPFHVKLTNNAITACHTLHSMPFTYRNDSTRKSMTLSFLVSGVMCSSYHKYTYVKVNVKINITLKYNTQLSLHQTGKARCRHSTPLYKFLPPAGNSPNLGRSHHLEWFQISEQPTSHSGLSLVLSYPMFCWYQFNTLVWWSKSIFKETCSASPPAVVMMMVAAAVGIEPGLPMCKWFLLTIILPQLIICIHMLIHSL